MLTSDLIDLKRKGMIMSDTFSPTQAFLDTAKWYTKERKKELIQRREMVIVGGASWTSFDVTRLNLDERGNSFPVQLDVASRFGISRQGSLTFNPELLVWDISEDEIVYWHGNRTRIIALGTHDTFGVVCAEYYLPHRKGFIHLYDR